MECFFFKFYFLEIGREGGGGTHACGEEGGGEEGREMERGRKTDTQEKLGWQGQRSDRDRGKGGEGDRGEKVPEKERSSKWSVICFLHFVLANSRLWVLWGFFCFVGFFSQNISLATPSCLRCLRTALPSVFQNFRYLLLAWFCLVSCSCYLLMAHKRIQLQCKLAVFVS